MKRYFYSLVACLILSLFSVSYSQNNSVRTVVHIVHPIGGGGMTNQEAEDAIASLNNYFSNNNASMKFVIDYITLIETSNTTFDYGLVDCQAIDPLNLPDQPVQNALNIYFFPSLKGGASGATINIPGNTCVIRSADAQTTTLPHEVGHCLGLYHTNEICFGLENNSGYPGCPSNCSTAGDKVCDTPAQRNGDGPANDNCGNPYPTTNPNLGNIMDIEGPPGTRTYFTYGQKQRMDYYLQNYLSYMKYIVYVTASNKVNGVNQSGTTLSFDGRNVNSGNTVDLFYGISHTSKTNHEILNTNYKHHDWDGNFAQFKLLENYEINRNDLTRTANFVQINPVNIKNALTELSNSDQGIKELKNPWLVESGNQPNDFRTLSSSSVNLFLNQEIVANKPYYSIRVPTPQNIDLGGTLGSTTFYFQNWSATNATLQNTNAAESGVVFNSANAVVTANYKGHLISNNSSGFNTNSQRKIVRTTDGQHHLIYESMGYVWYARSTDGGTTWSQEIKLNYLVGNSKNASIAVYGTDVYIAYQSDESGYYPIRLEKYQNAVRIWSYPVTTLSTYSYDTRPVVAAFENLACVVYKPTSTSSLEAVKFIGDGTKGTNYVISNTDANSTNPTLAASNQRFCVAYQNGTTQIRYLELSTELNSTLVFEYQVLSTGSPYTNNTEPSISAFGSGPIISWNGYNTSIPTAVVKRRENTAWSGFSSFGNSTVRYTNNNSISDGTTSSIIAWCDIYNAHKFVKLASGTYGSILSLPESGGNGQIQISNGAGFADMKAVVYKSPSSGIYPVKYVSYNFQTLQKMDADQNMNYGRTAIIQKEKKNFVYYFGGIKVDGEKVKFKDYIDTLKIENEEMMNNIMTTETFYLTLKSEVEFGNSFYAFDNDEYKKVKENDAAFSIELVKLNGKELKGEFNPSKFELAEITDDESFYKLDCSKIEEGYYYFRVSSKVNGIAEYFVNDAMYEDAPELNKKSFAELTTAENTIPNNYSLDNNYPNPFNPTTTITFAIPLQEYVTLKVYDVLGKEVATLVNGITSNGKHSVSFDGRDLASGIYFYTLKAGNFSQTNKMMLVK